MSRYASDTTVSPEKSRAEIESMLNRYGAAGFGYGHDNGQSMIMFRISSGIGGVSLMVRMILPTPNRDERAFTHTPTGKARAESQIEAEYMQEIRRRWRSLALIVKAKLEACASGISTIEREFMADVVDPASNRTLGETILPALEGNYRDPSNKPLALLPGGSR